MKEIATKDFDELFEQGEDVTPYLDLENAAACSNDRARISIAIPEWLMYRLDEEADRRAISRSAMINVVLVEWADSVAKQSHGKTGDGPAAA